MKNATPHLPPQRQTSVLRPLIFGFILGFIAAQFAPFQLNVMEKSTNGLPSIQRY
jgi:hypothetical protein